MMTIAYEPMAGEHIDNVCLYAVNLAASEKQDVEFCFNGIDVTVSTTDNADDVCRRWHNAMDKRHQEYLASPEHAEYLEKRRIEVAAKQQRVDRLLKSIPQIQHEAEWMLWAAEFAKDADDVDVKFDLHELSGILKSRGWVKNSQCSSDPKHRDFLSSNKNAMAEYIMGQVIACLDNGMPPHHITIRFVDQYRSIP